MSEHIAVEEQQGAEGLVLGGGRDLLLHREVRQKGLDVRGSHVLGMALIVEENVSFDPGDIGLLCMKRVMLQADGIAHVVKPVSWDGVPWLTPHTTAVYSNRDARLGATRAMKEETPAGAVRGGLPHENPQAFPSAIGPQRLRYNGTLFVV